MSIDQIKTAIHQAATERQKTAMFHFQVLTHAKELDGLSPRGFCKEIGVPLSYSIEFVKMLSLARLMAEQGARIV